MKKFIVANWKATKTIKDTLGWGKSVKSKLDSMGDVEVVLCPPYNSLAAAFSLFQGTDVKIGAQDVSKFKKGAYTGEVTVEMLDGLVEYCIVGHSERRKYFGETDDDIIEKVKNLLEYSITPILCVSNLEQLDSYLERGKIIVDSAEKIIFVYEPPGAISGGGDYHPETPDAAGENARKIGDKLGKKVTTLYGGSVNPENIAGFFTKENINGGLIGQASTDPHKFLEMLEEIKAV